MSSQSTSDFDRTPSGPVVRLTARSTACQPRDNAATDPQSGSLPRVDATGGVADDRSVLRVQSQLTAATTSARLARRPRRADPVQIADALFPSLDFAQRRLRTLHRPAACSTGSGRNAPTAAPTRTTTSSTSSAPTSSPRSAASDLPRRDQARRRRWHLTNRANLPHLLGVNQFFTDLAGHARTHPGCELRRWWPAARCQQTGASPHDGDDVARPRLHRRGPPGRARHLDAEHGAPCRSSWSTTPAPTPLHRLVDKLDGYHDLARVTGRVWPVLFWLPTPARERHLHDALSDARTGYPAATAAHDQPGHHNPEPEPSGGSTTCRTNGCARPNSGSL